MNYPFYVIKGGQAEVSPPPKEFSKFDRKRAIGDRMITRHIADRDKAIERDRANQCIRSK